MGGLFRMKMNYSAIYVTLATIFLLCVHTFVPSAIFSIILVVLVPLILTVGLLRFFEEHTYKDKWASADLEEYEADPDYDYYVSLVK